MENIYVELKVVAILTGLPEDYAKNIIVNEIVEIGKTTTSFKTSLLVKYIHQVIKIASKKLSFCKR